MARQHGYRRRRAKAPNTDDLVARPSGQKRVVVADGQIGNLGRSTTKCRQKPTSHRTPYLDQKVICARKDVLPCPIEEDAIDRRQVAERPAVLLDPTVKLSRHGVFMVN